VALFDEAVPMAQISMGIGHASWLTVCCRDDRREELERLADEACHSYRAGEFPGSHVDTYQTRNVDVLSRLHPLTESFTCGLKKGELGAFCVFMISRVQAS
jgi:hypothetical protein